jgi:hypothetical protein
VTTSDYHLVYLPGRGRVSHLLPPWEKPSVAFSTALCGREPDVFAGQVWLGTGNQTERDEAERRPLCKKCLEVRG